MSIIIKTMKRESQSEEAITGRLEAELPLLQSILQHPKFKSIVHTFQQIEYYQGKQLRTANPDIIELKLLQMNANLEQDERMQTKIQGAIDRLNQIINRIEEYNSAAMHKFTWLQAEIQRYSGMLDDMHEDIEIIKSQNKTKSQAELHRGNSPSEDEQLRHILNSYRCHEKPFPRNKTQALMLINRIESKIQQLEMKKLTSYTLEV